MGLAAVLEMYPLLVFWSKSTSLNLLPEHCGKRKTSDGTPCATDSQLETMQEIDVICCSVFLSEAAATEWQRATFGFAHTRPWVFSAWCWWTSTLRVKGLSYKSGTMALEVKTCTQASSKHTGTTTGLQKLSESECLGVFPAEMIFPIDSLPGDSHSEVTDMQPSRIISSLLLNCPAWVMLLVEISIYLIHLYEELGTHRDSVQLLRLRTQQ